MPEEKESIRLIRLGHDLGCKFYDTDEFPALESALDKIHIHGNRKYKDIEKLGTVRTQ